jgi:release factor glutamine methyltransferase
MAQERKAKCWLGTPASAFRLRGVTVLEAIQRSTEFLAKKGIESARLQTELLLAEVLKLPRMQLYLNFERTLTSAETEAFREFIRRRGRREPVQHILGSTSFCGYEISVNPRALVPRPETELLAEHGWAFLNQLTVSGPAGDNGHAAITALDFGTGSGCLAIALAAKCPGAKIDALDISMEALALARQNAARLGLTERIEFWESDAFAALPAAATFNLIVSNPPYIPSAEIETLQSEVRDYDPRAALDGGSDGLRFYRRLAAEAGPFLRPGGRLMVEFGDGQAAQISQLFEREKWIVDATHLDYNHKPRILIVRRAG